MTTGSYISQTFMEENIGDRYQSFSADRANRKSLSDRHLIQNLNKHQEKNRRTHVADDTAVATDIRRPFKRLYKEFKWLNAYAIINDVAVQEILKDLDTKFFVQQDCPLLRKNLESILSNSQLKHNHFIFHVSEDILNIYSNLFFKGNLRKAKKNIDSQKNISFKNAIILSFFTGGSIIQLCMWVSFILIVQESLDDDLHLSKISNRNEFETLQPLIRLFFVTAYIPFAAGLCILVFRTYDINYIHIMQIDYDNRMNHFQLWKIASILTFVLLTFCFLASEVIMAEHTKPGNLFDDSDILTKKGIRLLNRSNQILAYSSMGILLLIWVNPFKTLYRRIRFSTIWAFFQIIIAPFGNVAFKAYLLAEILTDCIIPMEDLGKIAQRLLLVNWEKSLFRLS